MNIQSAIDMSLVFGNSPFSGMGLTLFQEQFGEWDDWNIEISCTITEKNLKDDETKLELKDIGQDEFEAVIDRYLREIYIEKIYNCVTFSHVNQKMSHKYRSHSQSKYTSNWVILSNTNINIPNGGLTIKIKNKLLNAIYDLSCVYNKKISEYNDMDKKTLVHHIHKEGWKIGTILKSKDSIMNDVTSHFQNIYTVETSELFHAWLNTHSKID